jgi:site-specific DNA recombinase
MQIKTQVSSRIGGTKLTLKRFWLYIQNPIYAGVICEKWTNNQPIKGQFNGLISFELFNAANRDKLTLRESDGIIELTRQDTPEFQLRKGTHDADYPYRKVVTCSKCSSPLYGSAAKGRHKYYPAYHCNKRGHYFRVSKEAFETTIEDFIHKITFTQEHIDDLMKAIEIVWQQRQQETGKGEVVIEQRIQDLQTQAIATVSKIKLLSNETAIKYMEDDLVKLEGQIKELVEQKAKLKGDKPVSFDIVMKYTRYFLEHLDYLLLQQSDPIKKASFFGVIFNQTPTYEQIASGTADPSKLTGINELFKIKRGSISSMVRLMHFHSNTFWGG